ncbi:MAG: autotransporter-associated beta strand repeat-containing protein [Kiritimatiellales bacterium]|jgi:autotransporter-associated beta strand protein
MKKRALSILALVAGLCFTAQAASDSWGADADGNWWDINSWLSGTGYPGASNGTSSADTATFSTALTATRTVNVNGVGAIGTIAFGNTSTNNYLISGSTIRINNGGVIESLAGTGAHIDEIASDVNLRGLGNSVITVRNNSTDGGLKISGNINSTVPAGKIFTLVLDGSNTKAGIGAGVINNTISGNIGDDADGDVAVVKNGTGLWTLTGANTFAGGLTFNAGTLRYNGAGTPTMFGVGAINVASNGVTFNHANGTAMTIANQMNVNADFTLGGAANTTWDGGWDLNGGTRTLTVNADSTISGVISNGGLTKAGTKILTLTGANTYTGATTVSAGNLLVNGSLASDITVQNGGTLGGSGTVQAVTLDAGAILAAGNSPGTLTFEGDVLLSEGSTNIMEITDIAYDILMGNSANTLTMDGETVFDFTGFTGGVTNGYTIALSDMFSNWSSVVTTGATYSATGLAGGQSLNFTGGNLTVIPEPATVGMLGLGALITIMIRRVRRSN